MEKSKIRSMYIKKGEKMMKGIGMLFIAILLWGATIAPTKWALESVQPFTLLFLRLCFAGGICALFSFRQLREHFVNKNIFWKKDKFIIIYWCSWIFYVYFIWYIFN